VTEIEAPARAIRQVAVQFPLVALIVIAVGVAILIVGLIMMATERTLDADTHETKGILLIGPIPIVWGFGSRAQRIAIIVAVAVFVLCLMLVLW